jgi:hypothetical protein
MIHSSELREEVFDPIVHQIVHIIRKQVESSRAIAQDDALLVEDSSSHGILKIKESRPQNYVVFLANAGLRTLYWGVASRTTHICRIQSCVHSASLHALVIELAFRKFLQSK